MAKKDLYSSLQQIATETNITMVDAVNTEDMIDKQDIAKINQITELATKMYPTNAQNRFNYWKNNNSLDSLSNNSRNYFWKEYEKMHPSGKDGAVSDFINTSLIELNNISGVSSKEFFLRDRMANSPEWARTALAPELAKLSTVVATANFSKASQVYSNTLSGKVNKFLMDNELDPDVSTDQHSSDFMKLEQMNLFDVASVVNGRIGIYNQSGTFVPSFGLQDRKQAMPNDPYGAPSFAEQVLVKDTATQPIKEAIENKIYSQRSVISRQEKQSAMEVSKLLESGHYNIDRWNEAFAVNPESSAKDQVYRGLRGEIAAGRIKTTKELTESIYTAMSKYPNMFGDTTNAST